MSNCWNYHATVHILVFSLQASSGEQLYQTVGKTVSLKPFMYYAVTVQACTAGGCTTSPPTVVRTGTSKPSGQEPLRVLDVNNTAVRLAWNHPSNPNGQIRRCSLFIFIPLKGSLMELPYLLDDRSVIFDISRLCYKLPQAPR